MSIYTNKKLFSSLQDTLSKSDSDNIIKSVEKQKISHSPRPALKNFHTQTIPFDPSVNQSNKKEIENSEYKNSAFITYVNYSYVEQKKNSSNNINSKDSNSILSIKHNKRYSYGCL